MAYIGGTSRATSRRAGFPAKPRISYMTPMPLSIGMSFAHIESQERDAVPKLSVESLERRTGARGHGSGDGAESQQQWAPTDNVAFADELQICCLAATRRSAGELKGDDLVALRDQFPDAGMPLELSEQW